MSDIEAVLDHIDHNRPRLAGIRAACLVRDTLIRTEGCTCDGESCMRCEPVIFIGRV